MYKNIENTILYNIVILLDIFIQHNYISIISTNLGRNNEFRIGFFT